MDRIESVQEKKKHDMKKHLHTRFVNFLIEKYDEDPERIEDEEIPSDWDGLPLDFDEDEPQQEPEPESDEENEDVDDEEVNDDEVIDKLITEYKKVKNGYVRLVNKKKRRKTL